MSTQRDNLVELLAGLTDELALVRAAATAAADEALALGAAPAAALSEAESMHQESVARHLTRAIEETRAAIQAGDYRGRQVRMQEAAAAEQTRAQTDLATILRLEDEGSQARAEAEQLRRELATALETIEVGKVAAVVEPSS